jgi:hypothetical protein
MSTTNDRYKISRYQDALIDGYEYVEMLEVGPEQARTVRR